jgi:hypothetical protein
LYRLEPAGQDAAVNPSSSRYTADAADHDAAV